MLDATKQPSAPTVEESPPVENPIKRDAIVFVPPFERIWDSQALHAIAYRIARALTRETTAASFTIKPLELTVVDLNAALRVAPVTIVRNEDGRASEVLDIYSTEYVRDLVDQIEKQPAILRALRLLVGLLSNSPRIVSKLLGPNEGRTIGERWQIALGMVVLGLYALALSILVAGLIAAAGTTIATATTTGAALDNSVQAFADSHGGWFAELTRLGERAMKWLAPAGQAVALIWAFTWALLPPRAEIKESTTNAATNFLAMDEYLRLGTGRTDLEGGLEDLLDRLRDQNERPYRAIHLVSYSFGSLVALNTMFPAKEPLPPTSAVSLVHKLVTIGCPFDTVRAYWPRYFHDRHGPPSSQIEWLNVWSPTDVLGSNFQNYARGAQPDSQVLHNSFPGAPIPVNRVTPGARTEVSPLDQLLLIGLREHSTYWDMSKVDGTERNCFDEIVGWLYPGGKNLVGIGTTTVSVAMTSKTTVSVAMTSNG